MSIESIPIEGMTYSQLKSISTDGGDYKNGVLYYPTIWLLIFGKLVKSL